MTYIVALIGGIGSGKTTISNLFKNIGITIIDADVITRNILKYDQIIINTIIKRFGTKFLNTDQSINRKYLRNYIFSYKTEKLWLEKLLHPIIINKMKIKLNTVLSPWCLWVVPLLIEMKLHKYANRILLVDIPIQKQVERTIKRDKINAIQAKLIISSQVTRLERLLIAHDIINNTRNISFLKKNVTMLNKYYMKLSKSFRLKNKKT
ncbi:dephospho-CoA kinase [Buchnera aphidicola]|uniref:Dephospho-CoA kinase n=1 Tax=Buchnera aphidicola subsp. Melaphis rhois TaxID=118103 RepID=A0A4D6Y0R5_BUCMH|nr:dephospho-CoA kinase [Buchnera aphidicola]QCI23222.1 dephospho-CoA kinase [Buchnera aphidicola (Melaphis rhois)]